MSFISSHYYLFLFISVLIINIVPKRYSKLAIVLLSLYFAASYSYKLVLLLLSYMLFSYVFANTLYNKKSKRLLFFFVLFLISPLLLAKINIGSFESTKVLFFVVGISFFSLQCISYIVDVYRGIEKPEKNILEIGCYIAFFPQLVSGPIERKSDLLPQFERMSRLTLANFVCGSKLIVIGIFKKVVVAENLAEYIDFCYNDPLGAGGGAIAIACSLYAFQLFCDFSGFIDIARGSAKYFNIDLNKNFYFPLMSMTVTEFWRKWNSSLTKWFNDYVFLPVLI